MLFNRSVRVLLTALPCVLFSLAVCAHVETLHFYRSTGAGTWEQLPDVQLSITGDSERGQGSVAFLENPSGPTAREVELSLKTYEKKTLKEPDPLELCDLHSQCFFTNIPKKKKKWSSYARHYSFCKKHINETGDYVAPFMAVSINGESYSSYSMPEWETLVRFDRFLLKVLSWNAAQDFQGKRNEVAEQDVVEAKDVGIGAVSRVVGGINDSEDRMVEHWEGILLEFQRFLENNQFFHDFIFGTNCNWEIQVYVRNITVRAIQFSYNGDSFLLVFQTFAEDKRFEKRRSSPSVVSSGRRRMRSSSSTGSESGGSSLSGSFQDGGLSLGRLSGASSPASGYHQSCYMMFFQLKLEEFIVELNHSRY